MRKILLVAAMILAASPAYAFIKVTNLSGKPQSVSLDTAGSKVTRVIQPNMTEYFSTISEGMLSLNDPSTIAQAHAARPGPAGRVLGDLVASNRTSRIPASHGETYVIWPDGRLLIQSRQGRSGWSF